MHFIAEEVSLGWIMSCRAGIDHNLMRKALIKELRTFIKMSGFATVTSIYFGGG